MLLLRVIPRILCSPSLGRSGDCKCYIGGDSVSALASDATGDADDNARPAEADRASGVALSVLWTCRSLGAAAKGGGQDAQAAALACATVENGREGAQSVAAGAEALDAAEDRLQRIADDDGRLDLRPRTTIAH